MLPQLSVGDGGSEPGGQVRREVGGVFGWGIRYGGQKDIEEEECP